VQASAGVLRPRTAGGDRSRAPFSKFHQWLRKPRPTRSETAQNPKRNHPRPPFPETSRLDGVTPPQTCGTARYDGALPAHWTNREGWDKDGKPPPKATDTTV
jgi:hypothetical protein